MTHPKTEEDLERLAIEWRDKNQCWNCKEQALNAFEGGYRTALIAHKSETELLRKQIDNLKELLVVSKEQIEAHINTFYWQMCKQHLAKEVIENSLLLNDIKAALAADDKASEGGV